MCGCWRIRASVRRYAGATGEALDRLVVDVLADQSNGVTPDQPVRLDPPHHSERWPASRVRELRSPREERGMADQQIEQSSATSDNEASMTELEQATDRLRRLLDQTFGGLQWPSFGDAWAPP